MLDRDDPTSSEAQDAAGVTSDGPLAIADTPMASIAGLLAELLAELRRQTGLLERAHRHREREPRVLLSKRKAARLLGVSRSRTLDALIDSDQVRTVRLGGRLRIPLAEIERLQVEGPGVPAPTGLRAGRRKQSASAMNEALKRRGF